MIQDLMKVERVPLDRAQRGVEQLQNQKTWWQEIGRRMTSLRESARSLFSFQNPFSERVTRSSDESIITGTATREALEQERSFQITQIAKADRFLSQPLGDDFRVEPGDYTFTVGDQDVTFNFRGGTLREFTESLNRRGRNTVQASLITVERGSRSLLIESVVTGAAARLSFKGDAEKLALSAGIMERSPESRWDVELADGSLRIPRDSIQLVSAEDGELWVGAGGSVTIPIQPAVNTTPALVFSYESATEVFTAEDFAIPEAPPGPDLPGAGSVTYGGITIENDDTSVSLPPWETPGPPVRRDDFAVISLLFQDGSSARLPPIHDSESFDSYQYRLADLTGGKTVTGLSIQNTNTHRDLNLRNIVIQDPRVVGGLKPKNPVSTAQDALLTMDGITLRRPTNNVDDVIPGVTLTLRAPTDRPVTLGIEPDRGAIKEAIINLVGNYNRLMAEVNILTRRDERVIQDLTYLTTEEQEAYRQRLGSFSGDSTLSSLRGSMQRAATAPYLTESATEMTMLRQIGIGTDLRGATASTGYDPSRLRGYLEIDERALDAALANRLSSVQQLFGYDTDGDMLVDSGLAFNLDQLVRPYVETGGIISLKTSTIDSRLTQDSRRMETLERQLAARESALKTQYAQMESAYSRMERMSTSLDNFSRQANANNGGGNN
jgi:flagellar hook-associated protein 2